MNKQHTPGPWILNGETVHHLMFQEPLDQRNVICSIPNKNPETIRNEKLIAAAPALLEALGYYMSQFGQALDCYGIPYGPEQKAAHEAARAAINSATQA
jgi:hypothetical protein